MAPTHDTILAGVGPRLRALRHARSLTLADVAGACGLVESTMSRLETNRLRPTLAQALVLARFFGLSVDGLLDPGLHERHVRLPAFRRHDATFVRLSDRPGGIQAYRMSYRAADHLPAPHLARHQGFLRVQVLRGRLRVVVGPEDVVLGPGDAAEFDTATPHGMAPVDHELVEALMFFGAQGERPRMVVGAP